MSADNCPGCRNGWPLHEDNGRLYHVVPREWWVGFGDSFFCESGLAEPDPDHPLSHVPF